MRYPIYLSFGIVLVLLASCTPTSENIASKPLSCEEWATRQMPAELTLTYQGNPATTPKPFWFYAGDDLFEEQYALKQAELTMLDARYIQGFEPGQNINEYYLYKRSDNPDQRTSFPIPHNATNGGMVYLAYDRTYANESGVVQHDEFWFIATRLKPISDAFQEPMDRLDKRSEKFLIKESEIIYCIRE